MKKHALLVALIATLFVGTATAQAPSTLILESRTDYSFAKTGDDVNKGFRGEYFNFKMEGDLGNGFSYAWRQRINTTNLDKSFFDSTDWLNLNYQTNRWTFSAGKQVVAIAGYEYDRAPIDIYFASEFWNNINCYQWGVSGSYGFDDGYALMQICQSPIGNGHQNGLTAYNFFASYSDDDWEWSESTASINLMEYAKDKYHVYMALGERITWNKVVAEIDILFRGDYGEFIEGENGSFMFDLRWNINDKVSVFTHMSADYNGSLTANDGGVQPDFIHHGIGGGVEYFPLGNPNLRLHAAINSSGVWGEIAGVEFTENTLFCTAGLTWRVNLLGGKN